MSVLTTVLLACTITCAYDIDRQIQKIQDCKKGRHENLFITSPRLHTQIYVRII